MACVLLRLLMNLDKVKVISYAEGSSKRHSVEIYHVTEGRALSQEGVLSLHSIHESESESGIHSEQKFRENMEAARNEAINRIESLMRMNYSLPKTHHHHRTG